MVTTNSTVIAIARCGRESARRVAARMRTGNVFINYPAWDTDLPFWGYKQSGNGREYAEYGLESFLELKGIAGYGDTAA